MKEKSSGILIGRNKTLFQDLAQKLESIVGINDSTDDISLGYTMIKNNKPDLVFIDMTNQTKDRISLARRINKIRPETKLFFINTHKDADMILQGLRIGITDFCQYPFKDAEIENCVKKALMSQNAGKGAEIFTIFSLKGGTGVTTTSINLTDQIHDLTSDRVLLLDLNLFMGDICSYLNIKTSYSPYDFITDLERIDKDLLFSSLYCHDQGFYILTTPEEISDSDSINKEQIHKMLSILKQHFDYIIIDSPHDFSTRTLEVCELSDKIIVLSQQNIPTAKSVQKVIEFFKELHFEKEKIEVILNRYLKTNNMDDTTLEEIFRQKIFSRIENNYSLLTRAASKGQTLGQAGTKSQITKQFGKMAEKLTGIRSPVKAGWKRILQEKFRQ